MSGTRVTNSSRQPHVHAPHPQVEIYDEAVEKTRRNAEEQVEASALIAGGRCVQGQSRGAGVEGLGSRVQFTGRGSGIKRHKSSLRGSWFAGGEPAPRQSEAACRGLVCVCARA